MDQESKAKRWIIFGIIVVVLVFSIITVYKYTVKPSVDETAAKEAKEELIRKTSDGREYARAIRFGHDDFPSYAVLRSEEMQRGMDAYDTRLYFVDDKGDYNARLSAIQSGELDMAVFTIDADLVSGNRLNDFPGVMIAVIDKSNGADGIVCDKAAVPNAEALNRNGAKIVALKDSPSETIGRHLVAHALPAIRSEPWLIATGSQEETLEHLRKDDRHAFQCYALWEPYLSLALEIQGTHKVYGSDMVSGTIVDVLMVSRKFLAENSELTMHVLENYFNALAHVNSIDGAMAELIMRDAQRFGKSLTRAQADKIVSGILWANTMENYAFFGLLSREQSRGLPHMRLMIDQIGKFLVKTDKLAKNPVEGKEEILFTSDVLSRMQRAGYRPTSGSDEQIRGRKILPKLADEEWKRLVYIADLDAVEITFRPASSTLTGTAKRLIQEIIEQLDQWPSFYVEITGRAMAGGDEQANRVLSVARARSVTQALIVKGVNENRLHTRTEPQANHGKGRSVTFRLLQRPY